MPLSKRVVLDAPSLGNFNLFEDSNSDDILEDVVSSSLIGALNQLLYMSSYSLEVLSNLANLSEDTSLRIISLRGRVRDLMADDKLVKADSRFLVRQRSDKINIINKNSDSEHAKLYRDSIVPSTLTRGKLPIPLKSAYLECQKPPQFWRFLSITDQNLLQKFSDPVFFFQSWYEREYFKQQYERVLAKEEQKRSKLLRQQMKSQKEKSHQQLQQMEQKQFIADRKESGDDIADRYRNKKASILQVSSNQGLTEGLDNVDNISSNISSNNNNSNKDEIKALPPPPPTSKGSGWKSRLSSFVAFNKPIVESDKKTPSDEQKVELEQADNEDNKSAISAAHLDDNVSVATHRTKGSVQFQTHIRDQDDDGDEDPFAQDYFKVQMKGSVNHRKSRSSARFDFSKRNISAPVPINKPPPPPLPPQKGKPPPPPPPRQTVAEKIRNKSISILQNDNDALKNPYGDIDNLSIDMESNDDDDNMSAPPSEDPEEDDLPPPDDDDDDDDDLPPPEEEDDGNDNETEEDNESIPSLPSVEKEKIIVEKEKAAPPRINMLSTIAGGNFMLRKVEAPVAPTVNKNLAVAAILSNRKFIAGSSDSESDENSDTESDFSF